MEDKIPPILIVKSLAGLLHDMVADDLDLVSLRSDQVVQDGADDWRHSAAQDDAGDVVLLRPEEILFESRVQLDVLDQQTDALVVWGGDRFHHALEGLTEGVGAVEGVLVLLLALGFAIAQVVCLLQRTG